MCERYVSSDAVGSGKGFGEMSGSAPLPFGGGVRGTSSAAHVGEGSGVESRWKSRGASACLCLHLTKVDLSGIATCDPLVPGGTQLARCLVVGAFERPQKAKRIGDDLACRRIAALADKTLSENKINEEAYNVLMDELVGCDEMLETIKLCSMHQKRVADDVLSFSKLSMQLLTLNMRPLDVVELAEVTVKMLSSDLQRHSLRLTVTVDDSLVDNNARYVSADGHRLSQVLINCASYLCLAQSFTKP